MNCQLELIEPRDGRYLHRCRKCKEEVLTRYADPAMRKQPCGGKPKAKGPGTELRRMFRVLGVAPTKNCKCKAFDAWMDTLGVDGCRAARDEIAVKMQAKSAEFGLDAFLKAGLGAFRTGLAFKLNWSTPFLSLVDLAIERAEKAMSREVPTEPPSH
jgi:hypothetical protein